MRVKVSHQKLFSTTNLKSGKCTRRQCVMTSGRCGGCGKAGKLWTLAAGAQTRDKALIV